MTVINIIVEKAEHEALKKLKGSLTWKEYLMRVEE